MTYDEGDGPIEVVLDARGTTLGRLPTCDIVLRDPSVSRRHAEVVLGPSGWRIRDLGSRAGVRVGGTRVHEAGLTHGATIALGAQLLTLATEAEAQARVHASGEVLSSQSLSQSMLLQSLASDARELSDVGRLVRLAANIRDAPTAPQVAAAVLHEAALATGAERGVVQLIDEGGDHAERYALLGRDFEPSTTFIRRVLEEQSALIAVDVEEDAELAAARSVALDHVRSILAVPLWSGTRVVGVLYLDRGDGSFETATLELVLALGYLAAAELERIGIAHALDLERRRRHTVAKLLPPDLAEAMGRISAEVEVHEGPMALALAALVSQDDVDDADRASLAEMLAAIVLQETGGVLVDADPDHLVVLHRVPDGGDPLDALDAAARSASLLVTAGASLRRTRPRWAPLRVQAAVHAGDGMIGVIGRGAERHLQVAGPVLDRAREALRAARPGRIRVTDEVGPDLAAHHELVPEREGSGMALWMLPEPA